MLQKPLHFLSYKHRVEFHCILKFFFITNIQCEKSSLVLIKAAVSNLVANRHMWRQAQFLKFHIFGNFLDFGQFVHYKVCKKNFLQTS